MDDVAIPTPDPSPDVTDITAEQERINNIAAALRKSFIADVEALIAEDELSALNPTFSELRSACNTWVIQ